MTLTPEVVGVLPAAGKGQRLGLLPCSKEIYPVGFSKPANGGELRPRAAIEHVLDALRLAGVSRAFIVLRRGKWDIPAYLGDGSELGVNLGYLIMRLPYGTPFTLDQAYPFTRGVRVVLGFPDILFEPADAFARLLEKQTATEADVVLGLFPTRSPEKMDMVEVDQDGRVRAIVIKPARTRLRFTWTIAGWAPSFTEFLHGYVQQALRRSDQEELRSGPELFVGDVLQAALREGMHMESVLFAQGRCLDIGTPRELAMAVRQQMDLEELEEAQST